MKNILLNKAALQAARRAVQTSRADDNYPRELISIYLARTGFKIEKDGPDFRPYDIQRLVGPWEPIPIDTVEKED
jgi:hypothetical protein